MCPSFLTQCIYPLLQLKRKKTANKNTWHVEDKFYLIHFISELDFAANKVLGEVVIFLFQAMDGVPQLLIIAFQSHDRIFQERLLLQEGLVVPLQFGEFLLVDFEASHSSEEVLAILFTLKLLG